MLPFIIVANCFMKPILQLLWHRYNDYTHLQFYFSARFALAVTKQAVLNSVISLL